MKLKDIIGSMALKFAALVLTFGLAGSAWAATPVGTWVDLLSAANSGGEIVLTGDIEVTGALWGWQTTAYIENSVELDLAGNTISVPVDAELDEPLFYVAEGGTLIIKGNGTIDASSYEGSDFTVVNNYGGGPLTIKSGVTIKANLDAELNACALCCDDDAVTTVVEDGVVLDGLVDPDKFTRAADGKVVGKHTVSGGNVVVESSASDPSSGSDPVVAKIGDTEYTSLAAAVAAAQNGDTVTLIANATLSSQFTFSAGKVITLDLAGYTVSGASIANYGTLTIDDSVGNGGITAGAGADAAIVNDGTGIMNIKSGLIDGTATGVNAAVRVYSGTVTIDGGTFRSDTTSGSHYAIQNRGGTLIINDATVDYGFGAVGNWNGSVTTINGGTFLPTGRKAATCHVVYVDGTSNVTVNDGVFKMNYPVDAVPDSGTALTSYYNGTVRVYGGSFTGHFSTYAAVELSSGSLIYGGKYSSKTWLANYCAPDYKVTDTADEDGMYAVVSKGVAKIGSTYYQTLAAAVEAAQNGDTVQLLKDVDVSSVVLVGKSITIDGDGHKITTSTANRVIRVTTANIDVTFKDLEILSTCGTPGSDGDYRGISIDVPMSNLKVMFDNVKLTAPAYALNLVGGSGIAIVIKDSEIKGWGAINNLAANSTFAITNSTLHGYNDKSLSEWHNFSVITMDGTNNGGYGNTVTIHDSQIVCESTTGNVEWWARPQKSGYGNAFIVTGNTTFEKVGGEDAIINFYFEGSDLTSSITVPASMLAGIEDVDNKLRAKTTARTDNGDGTFTIKKFSPVAMIGSLNYESFDAAIAVADAAVAAGGEDPEIMVLNSSAPLTNPDWKISNTGYLVRKTYVAQIGETKYETLAGAIEAATRCNC